MSTLSLTVIGTPSSGPAAPAFQRAADASAAAIAPTSSISWKAFSRGSSARAWARWSAATSTGDSVRAAKRAVSSATDSSRTGSIMRPRPYFNSKPSAASASRMRSRPDNAPASRMRLMQRLIQGSAAMPCSAWNAPMRPS